MGLFGSIAGGALGAAGSIFGGISASKAMRKVKRNLEEQRQKNQEWFDREYNMDATQRADAQSLLSRTEEILRDRSRGVAGTQAVMGATDEGVAQAKAAANKVLSDAVTQVGVNGERRKDQVEQMYLSKEDKINSALNDLEVGKAQAIKEAAQGVAQAGAGILSAF